MTPRPVGSPSRRVTGHVDQQRDSDGFARLSSYGLIGDGHGAALVAADGSVDWLAAPAIDTPPFISGVIDARSGGHFRIGAHGDYEVTRRYLPGTLVLETTLATPKGTLRVTDCLNQGFQGRLPWSELARKIECTAGEATLEWELRPGTRLATCRPYVREADGAPLIVAGDLQARLLVSEAGKPRYSPAAVAGSTRLVAGDECLLALVMAKEHPVHLPRPVDVQRRLQHTIEAWSAWAELIDYEGEHAAHVVRSALTIKALQQVDSGAIAAAPTTALPEVVGGSRNFDYRFSWVRDASFMIDALSRLKLTEEVDASLSWLLRSVGQTAPDVHVFYLLDGKPAPANQQENELLTGYKSSTPVVIGNKAASQSQHGSYGDLFGAVFRHVENHTHLDPESAVMLARLADRLCDEWPKPDAGIWELGSSERYTSSLIGSWAALRRAAQLAERGELPSLHPGRWRAAADEIHAYADDRCWSEAKGSYTFYAGTEELDAAVLLAARTGFLAPDDPRLRTTIEAVRRELAAEGPWLFRYSAAAEEEHAFVACTFWLIEAMAIAGQRNEAAQLLSAALEGSNDLGLFGEEIDAVSGELLGNFPIGISHLAVIGAITAVCS